MHASSWHLARIQPSRGDPDERGDPRGGELALSEAGARAAYGGDGSVPSELWEAYASERPYVARSPSAEAAAAIVRNSEAITKDAEAQGALPIGAAPRQYDLALRAIVAALLADERELPPKQPDEAQTDPVAFAALAAHLDERICVPRDVGAPAAAAIRRVAAEAGDGGRAAGDDAAGAGRAEGESRKVTHTTNEGRVSRGLLPDYSWGCETAARPQGHHC